MTPSTTPNDNGDAYAPQCDDPDAPMDCVPMTDDEAATFAANIAKAYPDLVQETLDEIVDAVSSGMPPAQIIQHFQTALAMIDATEPGIRDMIESDLMDIAGYNGPVGVAVSAAKALSTKIAAVRTAAIKRAFRHLRDNLPNV